MSEYDEAAFRDACHAYGFAVHDNTPAEMIHLIMSFDDGTMIRRQRAMITRLRRLLFAFLWREIDSEPDFGPRELRTIRWAKRALTGRYRKALPKIVR